MNVIYAARVSANGLTIERTITRTVDGVGSREVILEVAKAGTLTTRTSTSVGTLTLSTGHGISTGMIVDLYWTGGRRVTVTVGTVSGNSVPFSLGSGTDLPTQGSAVTICQQKTVNVAIDGLRLAMLAIDLGYADPASTAVGNMRFDDADSFEVATLLLTANQPIVIDVTGNAGSTNPGLLMPFIETSATIHVTHSSTAVATLKMAWGADSTP